jgi:tetratricopeptide (TPR) repeat protein
VIVAAAAGAYVLELARRPRLPQPVTGASMPPQFYAALKLAEERATARGSGAGDDRDLAHLYQANRFFSQARACYAVIAALPGGLTPQDHYYLSAMAEDEGDLTLAERELEATTRGDPDYMPARLELAEALFKDGRPDDSAAQYSAVLEKDKNQPQALFGLARIEIQRGNDEAAVARLRLVVERHPESASAAALLAQVLERRGDADGADAMRELARQMHEPATDDPWTKSLLLSCYDRERLGTKFEEYRMDGQLDEAIPLLGRLEELDPAGWIGPMLRGWSDKEAGHYAAAALNYRKALERGADPERICPLLGAVLIMDGRTPEAEALLADYHAKMPTSLPILRSYSEVAVRVGDDALARGLLAQVLKADPYHYMANMSMVRILWNSGEHEAAAECLKRVARVYPADVDSRGILGQYYMEKADPWKAIGPLEQAVAAVRPDDKRRVRLVRMLDTSYLTAGSLEASQGDYAKAAAHSEKSIGLFPDGTGGYALLANVCARTKDFKGEARALGRLSSLEPDDPDLEMRLGDALYQDGDREGAQEHWHRALALTPEGPGGTRDAVRRRLGGQVTDTTFN